MFNEDLYKKVIENIYDGLYIVDKKRTILFWNKSAERISGFKKEEVIGKRCDDNILSHVDADGNSLCLGMCPLAETIIDGKPREAEVYLHHKEGYRIPVLIKTTPLKDKRGNIIGGIELFSDLRNRYAYELKIKELEKLIYIDELTTLANRKYIKKEIELKFEEKKRYDVSFGILFMDIDDFKKINDTYGHKIGDKILQLLANTLRYNSRPFDVYGRWGGEEFIGIIRNVDEKNLKRIGERVRKLVASSFLEHHGKKISVTISIGATLAQDTDSIYTLIERADMLMYKSKKAGKNCLTFG